MCISKPGGAPNANVTNEHVRCRQHLRPNIAAASASALHVGAAASAAARQTQIPRTILDGTVQQELSRDQAGGHDHARAQPCEEPPEARLLCEDAQAVGHRALRPVALVDLREKGVRRLRVAMRCARPTTAPAANRERVRSAAHPKRAVCVRTWLRIAAANPATIPLPSEMPNLAGPLSERFVSSDIVRNASSWQNSFTVNCPIAYGICLVV